MSNKYFPKIVINLFRKKAALIFEILIPILLTHSPIKSFLILINFIITLGQNVH